jgi:hypothetical protein
MELKLIERSETYIRTIFNKAKIKDLISHQLEPLLIKGCKLFPQDGILPYYETKHSGKCYRQIEFFAKGMKDEEFKTGNPYFSIFWKPLLLNITELAFEALRYTLEDINFDGTKLYDITIVTLDKRSGMCIKIEESVQQAKEEVKQIVKVEVMKEEYAPKTLPDIEEPKPKFRHTWSNIVGSNEKKIEGSMKDRSVPKVVRPQTELESQDDVNSLSFFDRIKHD